MKQIRYFGTAEKPLGSMDDVASVKISLLGTFFL